MEAFFHVGSVRTMAHSNKNKHAQVSVNMPFHREIKQLWVCYMQNEWPQTFIIPLGTRTIKHMNRGGYMIL